MTTYQDNEDDLKHDYLTKIGSYEMIFEHQKTMIYALKQMNHGMAEELQKRIDTSNKLMRELEEYDNFKEVYHKQFLN